MKGRKNVWKALMWMSLCAGFKLMCWCPLADCWDSLCLVMCGRGFRFKKRSPEEKGLLSPFGLSSPVLFLSLRTEERGLYPAVVLILLEAPEGELLPSFASCPTGQPEPMPWLLLRGAGSFLRPHVFGPSFALSPLASVILWF